MAVAEDRKHFVASQDFQQVQAEEDALIARARSEGDERAKAGLSFSGGGIRSASFSIGVLQALVAQDKLGRFDYLSTVSGGGYAGTALTWWLHRGLPTELGTAAGTDAASFPFGARPRTDGETQPQESETAQMGILDFLRNHASYLNPTPRLHLGSLIAVVMRAAAISLFVYFTLMTGSLGLLLSLGAFKSITATLWLAPGLAIRGLEFPNSFLLLAAVVALFLFAAAVLYSLWTFNSRGGTENYKMRTRIQTWVGILSYWGVGCLILGLVPGMHALLQSDVMALWIEGEKIESGGWKNALVYAALSMILGALLGAQEGSAQVEGSMVSQAVQRVRAPLAVALVCYGLLVGAYVGAFRIHSLSADFWGPSVASTLGPFLGILLVGLCAGWFTNINYMGVHRMYRDRLMELFTPNHEAIKARKWTLATEADRVGIHQVCGVESGNPKRPYHLVNTHAVLVDSEHSRYRGRGGDSFVLSPLYCGSEATGWKRSDRYMNAELGRGMSIASAMAISGAALNPNAGVSGQGATRSRLVSLLLSLLNLRLGYWAPNPAHERSAVPNFILPGLSAALTAKGLNEERRIVELSDGGHYENLGVYELIRRRVSLVVCCDAGADPDFDFADLANLVERVRADFGAKIYFPEESDLRSLVPGSADGSPLEDRLQVAERGYAIGKIRYQGDSRSSPSGTFVYLKTTMIKNLPADLVGYKLAHPRFPDESTGDQFFNEKQFEAYRELGYRIGEQWLESESLADTQSANI